MDRGEEKTGTEGEEIDREEKTGIEGEEMVVFPLTMLEDIVAKILSLTSPPDACRSSAVSRTFYAAAQSDIVWAKFLPSDWEILISWCNPNEFSFDPDSCSKKDIYFHLSSRPLLIDDGKRSFVLDKWSGKKCFMLGARDLLIVWGDTPFYWSWESHPDSRFAEVVVLLDVWWLEIRGNINSRMLSPATTYAAYFVFKMKKRRYLGFDIDPADAMVGIVGGEHSRRRIWLDPFPEDHRGHLNLPWTAGDVPPLHLLGVQLPRERSDGWFEVELGEFEIDNADDEIEIKLMEVKGKSSKSGMIVHGIDIRPKNHSSIA